MDNFICIGFGAATRIRIQSLQDKEGKVAILDFITYDTISIYISFIFQ
jgi:hypothetical protein